MGDLRRSLPPELSKGLDQVLTITKPDKNGRVGYSVQFKTVSACEKTLAHLRDQDFKLQKPHVTSAQDKSELARVGGSRMRAIADQLKASFEGIHVGRDFVSCNNVKIPAADFAWCNVKIGNEVVDVDKMVADNPHTESNPALRAYVDGREVAGVCIPRKRQRKDDQDGSNQVERAPPTQTVRAAAGNGNHHQQCDRPQPPAQRAGLTSTRPALDGRSRGGVIFFNNGFASHGLNQHRNLVMSISHITGQPSRLFFRRCHRATLARPVMGHNRPHPA